MLRMHLVFRDFSIYNPLSKDFPETDCHTFLNSISSFSGTFTRLCIYLSLYFMLYFMVWRRKGSAGSLHPSPCSLYFLHSVTVLLPFCALGNEHLLCRIPIQYKFSLQIDSGTNVQVKNGTDCSVRYWLNFEQHYKSGDDKKVPWNMIRC